jgi:type II secretory pathway component PulM
MMEKIKGYLLKRPPRERYIILAGLAVAFFFILYWLVTGISSPGPSRKSRIERALAEQKEFHHVLEKYKALHSSVQEFDRRLNQTQQDLDLFAVLNEFAQQAGIRDQIVKMDPSEGSGTEYYQEWHVDMNLQKVPLEPLVKFLKQIEGSSEFLRVTRMTIKRRFDQSEALDVTIRVNAYRARQGT